MKNYEPSFNFIKQNDNKIVAKSLDGNHNFVLLFDLDSIDAQNRIFVSLLKESIANGVNPSESFVIELNRFKSCIMKLECVNDKHVALAIFEYLIKIGHYSFNDDGNIRILEEVTDDMFDNPILMQKWICVYGHLLTTTEHAVSVYAEIYNRVTNILCRPNAIEMLNEKMQYYISEYKKIDHKITSGATVTREKLDKQEALKRDILRFSKQVEALRPSYGGHISRIIIECLDSISQFLDEKDIYIAAYAHSKAIFESGKEVSESDMNYAINLSKTVATLIPLKFMNTEIIEEDLLDENLDVVIRKYGGNIAILSENIDIFKCFNKTIYVSN